MIKDKSISPSFNLPQNEQQRVEQLLKQLLKQMSDLTVQQRFFALGPEKIFEFLYADKIFRMYLPFANSDLIQKSILSNGHFFEQSLLKTVKDLIPSDAIIVDAGANIGNHTLFFSGVCQARQVYAFEPLHVTFHILARNIALNHLTKVVPINAALGEQPGRTQLSNYNPTNIGGSSFQAGKVGEYELTSLDTLNLPQIHFLKMDVEGGFEQALRGSKETLKRCRPTIWIELRRKLGEFDSGSAVLKSLGYRLEKSLGPNDHIFVPI